MSKLRVLTALLMAGALPGAVHAQQYAVDKGSILLGGSASYTSSRTRVGAAEQQDRINNLALSPRAQLFVAPGLGVGAEVDFSRSSTAGQSATAIGGGPIVGYYFGRGPRLWHPFLEASGAALHRSRNNGLLGDEGNTEWQWRGTAGLLFLLSHGVGVNTGVFYQGTHTRQAQFTPQRTEVNVDSNTYGLAIGISAFVF